MFRMFAADHPNGNNRILFYSFEAEFITSCSAPTDCRDNNQSLTLPICRNPAIFADTFNLSPQWHFLIERKVRGKKKSILTVSCNGSFGIIIDTIKTIIVNKEMNPIPYDYYYTPIYENDIHVDWDECPTEISDILLSVNGEDQTEGPEFE